MARCRRSFGRSARGGLRHRAHGGHTQRHDARGGLAEIGELDAILGPESFQPGPDRNIWDRGGDLAEQGTVAAAQSAVNGLIPFRSWVRLISGASAAEREALRAFANGQQRRTFLRGYGASLGCPNAVPAPAPAPHTANGANNAPVRGR